MSKQKISTSGKSAVTVRCEGNDCMYPRITDRIVMAWIADQNGKWEKVGSKQNGTHQGYDANRYVCLSDSDIAIGNEILRNVGAETV